MAGVGNFSSQITEIYTSMVSGMPPWAQSFVNIALLVVLVTLFCIFVWKVYHIISKKNIIELNLNQYNNATHPVMEKFVGGLLYFIEYILLLPFLSIFWFAIFAFFLLLLTKGLDVQTVLMISTVIVAAIRATAYYREQLSKELAKLLPFTLLAVAMTESGFFNFQDIFSRFAQLPLYFQNILGYIAAIFLIEILLRIFDFIFSLFDLEDIDELEEEEEARVKEDD
jgi:hypothetical protein